MSLKDREHVQWNIVGDTAGSADLARKLDVKYDQGQGAELAPDSDAAKFIVQNTDVRLKGLYNTHTGGSPLMRAAVAHDFRESFGINVADQRAFVLQTLGRSVLEENYKIAGEAHILKGFQTGVQPYLLLEGRGWGNLTGLAADNFLRPVFYDPYAASLCEAIKSKIEELGPQNISGVNINRPANPDAKEATRQEIIDVFTMLDKFNAEPEVDITAIVDMPYGYGAPQIRNEKGRHLQTGFEGVLDDRWRTKWVAVRTGGKEFGAANVGLAFAAASANYPVEKLVARLTRNGKGLVCNEQMIANVGAILGDARYADLKWENRTRLHEKYVADRKIFLDAMGEYALPGGANMLSLSEFPREELIGRRVQGEQYGEWHITTRFNMVEYLMHEHDVAVVSMDYDQRPDSAYIRVAQRDKPDRFGEGTECLLEGIDRIRNGKPIEAHELAPARN